MALVLDRKSHNTDRGAKDVVLTTGVETNWETGYHRLNQTGETGSYLRE